MDQLYQTILIASIGTYGLATLISDYNGPGDVFLRLRRRYRVFECNVCIGIWILPIVVLLVLFGFGVVLGTLGLFIILARWI